MEKGNEKTIKTAQETTFFLQLTPLFLLHTFLSTHINDQFANVCQFAIIKKFLGNYLKFINCQ